MFTSDLQYDLKCFYLYENEAEHSNKIWGWVEIEGKMYNFWGRRDTTGDGKSVKFKRHNGTWGRHEVSKRANEKLRKGYREINTTRAADGSYPGVEAIYPNFISHMKKQLMFERLTGRVKNEQV